MSGSAISPESEKAFHAAKNTIPSGDNVLISGCRQVLVQADAARGPGAKISKHDVDTMVASMVRLGAQPGTAFEIVRRRYHDERILDASSRGHLRAQGPMHVDSLDTPARYVAFTSRAAGLVRYLAYTSDFGEAFRPVAHPAFVRATYAMSWAYVVGDVAYEAYNERHHGARGACLAQHATKRAVFQGIASMALPAVTIHTVVKQSKKAFWAHQTNHRVQTIGPTITGLACVPLLPYMFDAPVERAVDAVFDKLWSAFDDGHDGKHAEH